MGCQIYTHLVLASGSIPGQRTQDLQGRKNMIATAMAIGFLIGWQARKKYWASKSFEIQKHDLGDFMKNRETARWCNCGCDC
jgi:hypothetical protein